MMREIIIFALFGLSAVFANELYSNKYDYVEVDDILANPRQREQYYKCFVGTGPCVTADAKFFQEKFPEAIVTKCSKCTAKQLTSFDKLTDWYTTNEPEKYQAVVAKALERISRKSG